MTAALEEMEEENDEHAEYTLGRVEPSTLEHKRMLLVSPPWEVGRDTVGTRRLWRFQKALQCAQLRHQRAEVAAAKQR